MTSQNHSEVSATAEEIQRVCAAFAAGDAETARARLRALTAAAPPPPGATLEELGVALTKVGAVAEACPVLEQAFRAFVGEEQLRSAVRVAVRLVRYLDNLGELAAAHGWEQRALRLVAQIGPCLEQGYLARVG